MPDARLELTQKSRTKNDKTARYRAVSPVVSGSRGKPVWNYALLIVQLLCYQGIMSKPIFEDKSPHGRRAGKSGVLVGVRLQPDQLEALEEWRRAQNKIPSRPEAIRRLIALALGE